MNGEERIDLIHALMAASNAFHNTLRESGYEVSYGLDGTKIGSIHKRGVPDARNWALGELIIAWQLEESKCCLNSGQIYEQMKHRKDTCKEDTETMF